MFLESFLAWGSLLFAWLTTKLHFVHCKLARYMFRKYPEVNCISASNLKLHCSCYGRQPTPIPIFLHYANYSWKPLHCMFCLQSVCRSHKEINTVITQVSNERADYDKVGRSQIINKICKWYKHESKEQLWRWHYIMANSLQTVIKPLLTAMKNCATSNSVQT